MTVEITHSGIGIDVLATNNTPLIVEVSLQRDGAKGDQGIQGVTGAKGDPGVDFQDLELNVTVDNQAVFNIFNPVGKSNLFINDLTYFENKSYQIQQILGAWKLIWVDEFQLKTTDYLVFRIFTTI